MLACSRMSMRISLTLLLVLVVFMMTSTISEGKLVAPEPVQSRVLRGPRTVRVYLPPSYDAAPRQRYPVLYLHDGQNVFSSAGQDCCFGWGSWDLDTTVYRLIEE